jgi:uncharacterized protein YggE
VTGESSYAAKPTIGILQFGVNTLNLNAADALSENMKATKTAIRLININVNPFKGRFNQLQGRTHRQP